MVEHEQIKTQEPIPEEAAILLAAVPDEETAAAEGGEPPSPEIPTADLVRPLVQLVCGTVAPAWKISKGEQDTLTDAYAAVIDKYFPGGLSMGPEVGALLVTAAIIGPRLGQPMREEEPKTMPERGADETPHG